MGKKNTEKETKKQDDENTQKKKHKSDRLRAAIARNAIPNNIHNKSAGAIGPGALYYLGHMRSQAASTWGATSNGQCSSSAKSESGSQALPDFTALLGGITCMMVMLSRQLHQHSQHITGATCRHGMAND